MACRWLCGARVAVAVLAAALAGTAAAAPSCAAAERVRAKGYVVAAEDAYAKVLEDSPSSQCALDGLARLAADRCAAADRLAKLGRRDDAKERYQKVLESHPTSECALAGLERLAATAETPADPCATAEALLASHLPKEATAAYEAALQAKPGLACAVRGLVRLAPPHLVRTAQSAVDRIVAPIFLVVGPLLAVGLLVWLWIRRIHPLSVELDLDKIAPNASTVQQGPCEDLVSRIEEELYRLSRPARFDQLRMIDAPVDPPKAPDVAFLSKGASGVWDFLLALFPPRVVTLSGALRQDPRKGAGLSLRLVHLPTKQLWGTTVIWQSELDVANGAPSGGKEPTHADYARLTRAAAAWIRWTLHDVQAHRGRSCAAASCRAMRDSFGTGDWRSYALGQEGLRCRTDDSTEAADRVLRLALQRDPFNVHALHNLGVLKLREYAPNLRAGSYAELRRYFRIVKRLSRPVSRARGSTVNPTAVFSEFQLGAIALYRHYQEGGKKRDAYLRVAEGRLRRAARAAEGARELTESARLDGAVALATCLRLRGKIDLAERELRRVRALPVLPPSVLYNLACYHGNPPPSGASLHEMDRAGELLDRALVARPRMAAWAMVDPSLALVRAHRDVAARVVARLRVVLGSVPDPASQGRA